MDTDDPKFMLQLMKLRHEVQEHARAEERYEFIHIRRGTDTAKLAAMAKAIKAAEAIAPTRPRPRVESGAANMTLGPVAALMDRTKDTVRKKLWARTADHPTLMRLGQKTTDARAAAPPQNGLGPAGAGPLRQGLFAHLRPGVLDDPATCVWDMPKRSAIRACVLFSKNRR
ncbi:hypothetical protein ABZV34_34430 [Streptomyces sp. NPDC005195]|uniref:hypothetical protein n=1 Tax=Streptomyces sp. NPDC005195 TaxID=3154561 RepID=UPI0033B77D60